MPRLPSHPKHHYTLTPCERALCVSTGRLVVAAVDLALSVEDATPDCARGGAAGKAWRLGARRVPGERGEGPQARKRAARCVRLQAVSKRFLALTSRSTWTAPPWLRAWKVCATRTDHADRGA